MKDYFYEHIEELSNDEDMKRIESLYDEIIRWYDGYSWDGRSNVMNPFSLLNLLIQKRFASYWFASGTPQFLMEVMKKKPETFVDIQNMEAAEWVFDTYDIENIQVGSLLFQTGYLTIKEKRFRDTSESYLLGTPNHEVKEAFNMNMLSELTEAGKERVQSSYTLIKEALNNGDLQRMVDVLKGLFASIPYHLHIDLEAYYHSIFYAVFNVLGFHMKAEVATSYGRVDGVLELKDKVYVMEFKYKKWDEGKGETKKKEGIKSMLDEGMAQINNKGYVNSYKGSGKRMYQVAIAFLGRDEIEMKMEVVE